MPKRPMRLENSFNQVRQWISDKIAPVDVASIVIAARSHNRGACTGVVSAQSRRHDNRESACEIHAGKDRDEQGGG